MTAYDGRSTALRYASQPAPIERPPAPVLVAMPQTSLAVSVRRWASFGGPAAVHVTSMARAMDAVESLGRVRGVIAAASLGGSSGLELLGRLHAVHPGLPSLIVMGTQRPTEVLRTRQLGAAYLEETADLGRIAGSVVRFALGALPHARQAELVIDAFASTRELSRREHEILSLFARGVPRSDLAEVMGVRENTLKTEVRALLAKCECSSLEELFRHLFAIALGGIQSPAGGHGGHVRRDE